MHRDRATFETALSSMRALSGPKAAVTSVCPGTFWSRRCSGGGYLEEAMAKEPYRDPQKDRTALYAAAGIAALVALGVVVWAASDYTPVNPSSTQTESERPKEK